MEAVVIPPDECVGQGVPLLIIDFVAILLFVTALIIIISHIAGLLSKPASQSKKKTRDYLIKGGFVLAFAAILYFGAHTIFEGC